MMTGSEPKSRNIAPTFPSTTSICFWVSSLFKLLPLLLLEVMLPESSSDPNEMLLLLLLEDASRLAADSAAAQPSPS